MLTIPGYNESYRAVKQSRIYQCMQEARLEFTLPGLGSVLMGYHAILYEIVNKYTVHNFQLGGFPYSTRVCKNQPI